jgi:hypothetical protein
MKPPDIRYEEREKRDGSVALCHPETGEELGRFLQTATGWVAYLNNEVDTFPTRHAARMFILERHRPEAS